MGEKRDDSTDGWQRREVAKAALGVGGVSAALALAAPATGLTKVLSRAFTGEVYTEGTYLVDENGERIRPTALEFGEQITVFPETHPGVEDAPTLLVRYEESAYGSPTELAFTVNGYAAYSKVCTHAGCMVSETEDDGTFVCPCHFAKFDPTKGAEVTGGPAPRALPQLPITLSSDGFLMATENFEGPIGPGGE
ncbi:Rieske (2Fe-2S) protein [Halodesulfurarchaeum sp. HSR-GB]|uniref:QcrA and Rieske domain-containing protein n=1 Tax=Halodesulfurarchaeum sp. HSR-GB TaxID=3074077 RepID=UPI0028626877|nr:Rieske (2Fe-2S) protein [Halodesulfurarchaeum sp. HSR-GB]MDR5656430.1 Rieske (2Fe-2S) protein [Halodesulfurarchaeum sp. HSR-GB]